MFRRMGRFLLLLLPLLITSAVWMAWWLTPEQPLRSLFVEMDTNNPPLFIRGAGHDWALIVPYESGASGDRDWRFDSKTGTATAIRTPTRIAGVSRSPTDHSNDWWVWADRDGQLHVM